MRETLAGKLLGLYERCHGDDWEWFEDIVTYDNANLPHALHPDRPLDAPAGRAGSGLRSLRWLMDVQNSPNGCYSPIGSNGFYRRGEERAHFDQQPLEAGVDGRRRAWKRTGSRATRTGRTKARVVFEWFLGRNDLGLRAATIR